MVDQREKEVIAAELDQMLSRVSSWEVVDEEFAYWVKFEDWAAKPVDQQPAGWMRIGKMHVSEEGVARAIVGRRGARSPRLAIYYRRTDKRALPEVFFIEAYRVDQSVLLMQGLQMYHGYLKDDDGRERFFLWYRGPDGREPSEDFDVLVDRWLPQLLEKIAIAREAWTAGRRQFCRLDNQPFPPCSKCGGRLTMLAMVSDEFPRFYICFTDRFVWQYGPEFKCPVESYYKDPRMRRTTNQEKYYRYERAAPCTSCGEGLTYIIPQSSDATQGEEQSAGVRRGFDLVEYPILSICFKERSIIQQSVDFHGKVLPPADAGGEVRRGS